MDVRLEWPRWSSYEAHPKNGWLYASGEQASDYVVNGDDDLPSQLAGVRSVDDLVAFYRTFGSLGRAMGGDHGLEMPPRQRFDGRWEIRSGDPVEWALAHAENIRLSMRLHRAEGAGLVAVLTSLRRFQDEFQLPLSYPTLSPPWGDSVPFDIPARRQRSRDRVLARRLVAALVSPNLETVHRIVDPETNAPQFRFRSLIEVIYWQLADSLGHHEIGQCACGKLFFRRDPRQRFCPPNKALRGESLCAKRYRMRRARHPRDE